MRIAVVISPVLATLALIVATSNTGSWFTLIGILAPILLIVLFFILFMSSMQGGVNRVMSFGKSRARRMTKDQPKVTFSDVAGADEAVQELTEIKEFLEAPQKFQKLGARIPKGVLLVGSPGTGKTLLARAVAGEAGVPFFSISGSDFIEMFVGVGASRVKDLFEQAKQNSLCIIFMDEIDAVGRQRGAGLGGGHDEREQTSNQLLVEMDGFDSKSGIIMLAATNRPDILDPALLRPGRFDRQIVVDRPDLPGREKILKVHTRSKPLGADVEIETIPRGQALGVTMSLPTEDRFMMSRSQLMAQLAMMLGGRAAEQVVFDEITTGASNDLERVTQTARQMVTRFGMSERLGPLALEQQQGQVFMGRVFHATPEYSDEIAFQIDKEIRRIVDESYDTAEDVLLRNRLLLDKLAKELIEYETVDAEHLKRLIEEYAVGPEAPQRVGTTLGKESR